MIVSDSGTTYTPVPEGGPYTATCIRVVDLGTQRTEYKGEVKHQHKILIAWEIPEVRFEDRDGKDMPALIQKRYTASLHEKAQLRGDLEAWRGRKFTAEELKGFDLANLLGKSCLIQVVHNETAGNTYANINAIMALPKGTTAPAPEHGTVHFDLQKFSQGILEGLSEKLQDQIKQSPEYKAITGGVEVRDRAEYADDFSRDPDDEIPF